MLYRYFSRVVNNCQGLKGVVLYENTGNSKYNRRRIFLHRYNSGAGERAEVTEEMVTTFDAIPEMSEREKMMETTAEEITQLLRERNLTVGEARSVLDYAERTISRSVEEMPVSVTAREILEMQADCKDAKKNRRRTKRLLAAFQRQNPQNEVKGQGFELPYRS